MKLPRLQLPTFRHLLALPYLVVLGRLWVFWLPVVTLDLHHPVFHRATGSSPFIISS